MSAPRTAAAEPGAAGTPPRGEVWRIVASMTVTCALGAALLGGVFVATDRYQEAARVRGEREAVAALLRLDQTARVLEVRQLLDPERRVVIYRAGPVGKEAATEVAFGLDGALVRSGAPVRPGAVSEAAPAARATLLPLGRFYAAEQGGEAAGFVIEGEARGYKNRIRYFVAIDPRWEVAGVRVIEHEEDPGLGAEIATPWFVGQFEGRPLAAIPGLSVTRDPMPEDWRAALSTRGRVPPWTWKARHRRLEEREAAKPIYAVTGATISSRALTDGVRSAVLHFHRRWELVRPHLGEAR